MSRSQREKGHRGEIEVVHILNEHGFPARRGQVFNGEPDVICPSLPLHLEIKRQETYKIGEWWKQSESAAGDSEIPTVIFRKSREPWKIMLSLTDFLEILKEANR